MLPSKLVNVHLTVRRQVQPASHPRGIQPPLSRQLEENVRVPRLGCVQPLPVLTIGHRSDGATRHAKPLSQLALRVFAGRIQAADFANLILG